MSDFPSNGWVGQGAVSAARGEWVRAAPFVPSTSAVIFSAFGSQTTVGSPLSLPPGRGIDGIGINVTAGGTAGSLIRMGVYAYDPVSNFPSNLLIDAGTIDGTLVGLSQIIFPNPVYSRTGMFVPVACAQGLPATEPTVAAQSGTSPVSRPTLSTTNYAGFFETGVAGLLPSVFTVNASRFPTVPTVFVRVV